MRLAFADAFDGRGDPPVRLHLEMGRKRPLRALRILEERERAREGMRVAKQALDAGGGYAHAAELGAEAAGMNIKRFESYRADLNATDCWSREVLAAMEDGKSDQEIHELIYSPPAKRKKGRKPKR
jgi:hypothetical protein